MKGANTSKGANKMDRKIYKLNFAEFEVELSLDSDDERFEVMKDILKVLKKYAKDEEEQKRIEDLFLNLQSVISIKKKREKENKTLKNTFYGEILKKLLIKRRITSYDLAKELGKKWDFVKPYLKNLQAKGLIKIEKGLKGQRMVNWISLTEEGFQKARELFKELFENTLMIKVSPDNFSVVPETYLPNKLEEVREIKDYEGFMKAHNPWKYYWNVRENVLISKNTRFIILFEVLEKSLIGDNYIFTVKPKKAFAFE
jgi:DNA-binding MarR family transcriptional regulator